MNTIMNLDPRRYKCVTASDVPAICGECPFSSRWDAMRKKVLRIETPDNDTMAHGRKYEPVALKKFCEATGAEVVEYPCAFRMHPTYAWLGGTFDALVRLRTSGETVVVEIKCPPKRTIREDEVPNHYIGQVQTYLSIVRDAPFAIFVQYKPAGPRSPEKLTATKVARDDGYMSLRLPKLKLFWDEMVCRSNILRAALSSRKITAAKVRSAGEKFRSTEPPPAPGPRFIFV